MLLSNQKTSLLVPSQLPGFVRDDPSYNTFVTFVQAYYEWMEQEGNILDTTKNLLTYKDIDGLESANISVNGTNSTIDQFINYYQNDFLSYFPKDILANQTEVIKLAKQLYQSKGTPASYKFLFRILYNTEVDFFNTKDALLKPSSGKWYIPLSLSLSSTDTNFLKTTNLRIFGLTSKSIATIENPILVQGKVEIFISNMERLFQSGEFVNIVDSNNQIVYFLNGEIIPTNTPELLAEAISLGAETLTAKIVGQISQINVNKNYRGQYYNPGNPVIIYGGLDSPAGQGAAATVGTVTTGFLDSMNVVSGGYGYTSSLPLGYAGPPIPDSIVNTNVPNAIIVIPSGSLNPVANGVANVRIPNDALQFFNAGEGPTIGNTTFSFFSNNITANANTSLTNTFNFLSFTTYPITSVAVENGGGGISVKPVANVVSTYPTSTANTTLATPAADLSNLGILSPIQISAGGSGYVVNDQIVFSGGSGIGAYANVLSVNSIGAITSVGYVYPPNDNPHQYLLGGFGYNEQLPLIWVKHVANGTISTSTTSSVVTGGGSPGTSFLTQFSNGSFVITSNNIILGQVQSITNANSLILTSNSTYSVTSNNFYLSTASLYVPGTLGTGAILSPSTIRVGEITTIAISDYGQDYITAPTVSLAVEDIVVTGLNANTVPLNGNIVYQGPNVNTASYKATVYSTTPNVTYSQANQYQSTYNMRVFDYTSNPNPSVPLNFISSGNVISFNISSQSANVTKYGDGTARATASFLNGLSVGQGQYLDNSGQPSSYDVLQSVDYNNYTYEITLEKEIEKYRNTLLNLLHPTGMKVRGRYAMKSNSAFTYHGEDALIQGYPLSHYTGTTGSTGTIAGSFVNPSNNTIVFNNLAGAEIQNFIFPDSTIHLTSSNGDKITSTVSGVFINYEDLLSGSGSEDLLTESGTDDLLTDISDTYSYITLTDNFWMSFANVAYVTAVAGSNVINIVSLTDSFNIMNDGIYTNPNVPLMDIIRAGDNILVNNMTKMVTSIDYTNNILYVNGTLAYGANALLSVSRTYTTNDIQIYGTVGIQYTPELSTEDGNPILYPSYPYGSLTNQQGNILILG